MSSSNPSRTNKFRIAALGGIAGVLSVAAAACGTSPPISAKPIGTKTSYPGRASESPVAKAGTVGADCGMIPAFGGSSLPSMSTQEALNAAAANPQLSVFIAAVRTARLDSTLNARHAYTLMIPENSSFASLSKTTITHLHNSGDLTKIVRYHAVNARIMPSQFSKRTSYATMEGSHVKLSKSGSTYRVNGATVLCGNIRTMNATVYIINKVLLPPGS